MRDDEGDGRQPRVLRKDAIDVEHLGVGSPGLLDGLLPRRQTQAVPGLGRLQRVHRDHVAQIDAFEQRPRLCGVIAFGLAEDPHRRVVIDAEGFFGRQLVRRRPADLRRPAPADLAGGVAEVERPDARVLVKLGHQLETQIAVEQRLVVLDHQRVGQRQARQVPHGPLAGDGDEVGFFQPAEDLFALFRAVRVGHGFRSLDSAGVVGSIRVAAVQPDGQRVVPMFVENHARLGANGAAYSSFGRQANRAGRDGCRRKRQLNRLRARAQVQRQLGGRALVDGHADRLAVFGRLRAAVEVGVAQIIEAHGPNDAVFGHGEVEEERDPLMLEQHGPQRQLKLAGLAGGRLVYERGSARHMLEHPLRGGDPGQRFPVDAGEGDRPQQAGQDDQRGQGHHRGPRQRRPVWLTGRRPSP